MIETLKRAKAGLRAGQWADPWEAVRSSLSLALVAVGGKDGSAATFVDLWEQLEGVACPLYRQWVTSVQLFERGDDEAGRLALRLQQAELPIDLTAWLETSGRTKNEVLAVFDKALVRLKTKH